ncbi:protein NRT1/ PTR FAMILY 5.7 isoform X1 [Vigna radiata var. radiata]|uniref:Protein NRT1/ PTR FAMILY 5.7 isoform X1 n=1 Tax=Vigna radiata var. radiata TaxID=3916 RepID=A0A3Q0FHR3_VIGRR|nr:protein NRT1/ PTR FAMILY 5.7 isoform X1 [Vigna radiata var. radiata]
MALKENGPEINFSFALMKNLLHQLRHLFFNSKTHLLCIGALSASYTIVEFSVVSTMMDYWKYSEVEEDLRKAAVLTNLQDGLSSVLSIFASLISESYTGPLTMITICAAAAIQGLMLLWTSANSVSGALYAAILFLALGKSGQTLLGSFLKNKVEEILEEREKSEIKDGSTEKQNGQDLVRTILTNTWLLVPLVVGYVVIVFADFANQDYYYLFRSSAILMGGCYLLFLFGRTKYSHEQLLDESNLGKIFRICKAACGRRRSDYPTSPNCYYWKGNVRTNLCYDHGKGLRLKPRVPRLFRWLDKAAILNQKDSIYPEVSPDTQERNGKVCTVEDVREVKSFVPMIYLCFTFFAYSLLVATGNTFFVAQASNMKPTKGYDISRLFLIKTGMRKVSQFIFFWIVTGLRSMRTAGFTSKRFTVTTSIISIGFGMVCAVICCVVAWKVELQRLSLTKYGQEELKSPTRALVPQFILLGMTEALVEGGLKLLYVAHVEKALWSFTDSYIELLNGIGKLLFFPLVVTFSGSWFKESIDTSHVDRFYLMLGILNAALLQIFAYYSFKYTYNEISPEDDHADQPEACNQEKQSTGSSLVGKSMMMGICCCGLRNFFSMILVPSMRVRRTPLNVVVWEATGRP